MVFELMIKESFPFDITITFDDMSETEYAKCYKIYSKYFGSAASKLFQQYKQPIPNQYCAPLMEPQTSFNIIDSKYKLHLSNASQM